MSDIIVKVPFTCSRTNKEHQVSLPLAEAAEFGANLEQKIEVGKEIAKTLTDMPVTPDFVVFYQGRVHVLSTVHESQAHAIGRNINQILRDDNAYEVAAPRKRKSAEEKAADVVGKGDTKEPKADKKKAS